MPSADFAPMVPHASSGHAQSQNTVKSAEKFFKHYTWATDDNPEQELTDEELVEVRAQRIKLRKAVHKLKGGDPRKEQGQKRIELLDRRIARGALTVCLSNGDQDWSQ